jgi:hypothetical protein
VPVVAVASLEAGALVVVVDGTDVSNSVVVVAPRTRSGPVVDRSRTPASAAPHPASTPTARAIAHPLRRDV